MLYISYSAAAALIAIVAMIMLALIIREDRRSSVNLTGRWAERNSNLILEFERSRFKCMRIVHGKDVMVDRGAFISKNP